MVESTPNRFADSVGDAPAVAAGPTAAGTVARRTAAQAVYDLLPNLTRPELTNVVFKTMAQMLPPAETREMRLLNSKTPMQRALLEKPWEERAEALRPYVEAAKADGFLGHPDPRSSPSAGPGRRPQMPCTTSTST